MKFLKYIVFLVFLSSSCSKQKEQALIEKVDRFKVSQCRKDCNIDSVGIRKNELIDGDLHLKFGYFLNCSWEDAFIEAIEKRNDTMIIHVDRPHEADTTLVSKTVDYDYDGVNDVEIVAAYPLTDCECFFFFNLKISAVEEQPKVIRIAPKVDRDKFWDQSKKNTSQIRTSKNVFSFNSPPVDIKKLVLNTKLFDVTSGIIDAKYLDEFCKFEDYQLERKYNLISKIESETVSILKVYVNDDRYKMNRKHANEEFQSIDVNYKYLKLWNTFHVGMLLEDLLKEVTYTEYHKDVGKITVNSKQFKSEFYHNNSVVTRIVVQRICAD